MKLIQQKMILLLFSVFFSFVLNAQTEKGTTDFVGAFEQGGVKIETFQKEFWTSSKTEEELLEELDSDLRPIFVSAFLTELNKLGQRAQNQSASSSFQNEMFSIETVNHEIGEELAEKIRPIIPDVYDEVLDSLIFSYRGTMSIDSAKQKTAVLAADRIMETYQTEVNQFLQRKKENWSEVNVYVETNLDKAKAAYENRDLELMLSHLSNAVKSDEVHGENVATFARMITTLYSDQNKFLVGYQEAKKLFDEYWIKSDQANLCLELAEYAMQAEYYSDAGKLADQASINGTTNSIVNQLKYRIYDSYYESVKRTDRSLAKKIKQERDKYEIWKP